jgi:hypothetical protein
VDFVYYDMGQLNAGQIIEVTLNIGANVQLLDPPNFNAYRNGMPFNYFGGHVTVSPYRLTVPTAGHWHLAIDLGGAAGQVISTVRVL